jgi:hypothetical protein
LIDLGSSRHLSLQRLSFDASIQPLDYDKGAKQQAPDFGLMLENILSNVIH